MLLVDRYKYLNLFPCSNNELLSMNYPVSCTFISTYQSLSFVLEQVKDKEGRLDLYSNKQGFSQRDWLLTRPDVHQMMPFKPSAAEGQQ